MITKSGEILSALKTTPGYSVRGFMLCGNAIRVSVASESERGSCLGSLWQEGKKDKETE
jgi:hypothetical protein